MDYKEVETDSDFSTPLDLFSSFTGPAASPSSLFIWPCSLSAVTFAADNLIRRDKIPMNIHSKKARHIEPSWQPARWCRHGVVALPSVQFRCVSFVRVVSHPLDQKNSVYVTGPLPHHPSKSIQNFMYWRESIEAQIAKWDWQKGVKTGTITYLVRPSTCARMWSSLEVLVEYLPLKVCIEGAMG